jgi:hypothetical protein
MCNSRRAKTRKSNDNGNNKDSVKHETGTGELICTNSGTTTTPDSSRVQSNDMQFDSYAFTDFGDFDNFIDYRYGMISPLASSPTEAAAKIGTLSEEWAGKYDCCGLGYNGSCFTEFSQSGEPCQRKFVDINPNFNGALITTGFEPKCISSNFLRDENCFSMTPVGKIICEETISCKSTDCTDCTAVDDYLSCSMPHEFYTELTALCSDTVTI